MKEINTKQITETVASLCIDANYNLSEDVIAAIKKALETEESPTGKEILEQILENAQIAGGEKMPMCQDTGLVLVFLELGQEVKIVGGDLNQAINEGVHRGYKEGYLRASVVGHPFARKNTGDNTPAIIYTNITPGDKLKITVAPKGGGSENMSATKVLKPAEGSVGVKKFVVEQVGIAGANPCPPVIVGVGIGGTLDKAVLLSKKALLHPVGEHHPAKDIAQLEKELLEEINNLGIGPQGLGGRTTALAVHVEIHPCHIASLPVAVNIGCHAHRHKEAVL